MSDRFIFQKNIDLLKRINLEMKADNGFGLPFSAENDMVKAGIDVSGWLTIIDKSKNQVFKQFNMEARALTLDDFLP